MAIITTPGAGVSPYETTTTPTVLRAGADGSTTLASIATTDVAAATTVAAATDANTSIYVSGQAALNSLITSSQPGVFQGANVTINLEEQNFNTTNQVTSNTNYPSGNTGEIQYNSGSNSFASDPYFTYANSNIITPSIRTNSYLYANGAPFLAGGNAAIGNFVFTGDTMTISDSNQNMNIISNGTGNVNVTANTSTWIFGTNSILTLPGNSRITPVGANLELQAGTGGYAAITTSDGNSTVDVDGGGAHIVTSGINTWTFDNVGNLILPGNTFAVKYANGNPVVISDGSANTGNVTFSDQIVIGTGDTYGGGGLYLASGPDSVANLQYLRVRGGDYPTHIHFDTGNVEYYDQYFGNDNKYVKLEAGFAGNIVIGTDDDNGNLYNWTYDSTGQINLPANAFAYNSGRIQSANGYPTLLAYGSDGDHGGPELDWMNSDNLANAFIDNTVLRNTMYLNESGLYIGINENNVANVAKVNWNLNPDGSTIFPTLSVQRGDTTSGTITGQTLLFGDATQEAIISTPNGNPTDGINSQRLVINPGAGNASGEGGDIYLWAGRGGDASGSGGDIKIRGGQGGANTNGGAGGAGGYIRMEAGDAASTGGAAGYIEITGGASNTQGGLVQITGGQGTTTGGDANIRGGTGDITGGNVNIWGGASNNGQINEGHVNIQTGGNTWIFNSAGELTLPGATANETIATQSGYITVGNLLVGQGGSLFNTNNDTWALYGNLSDPGVSITIPSNAAAANLVPLNITSFSNVEITSAAGTWNFRTDGILTTPGISGDITGANLIGTASVSASGNIFGNNINSNYDLSAFGNVYANSVAMDYLVSSANLEVTGHANVGSLSTVGSVSANGNITTLSAMYSGNGATWQSQVALANVLFVGADVATAYVQSAMINTSGNGSADWVSYSNNGNSDQGWIDMGFTGNTFNDPAYTITDPNDGYILVQGTSIGSPLGGNLILATGNIGLGHDIVFATGGYTQANIKARIINTTGEFSVVGNILTSGVVKSGVFGTGNIPTASSVGAGSRAFVIDADNTIFGNLYVGGAGNSMPVWSNGTNWYIG